MEQIGTKEFILSLEKYEFPTIKEGACVLFATTSRLDAMPDVKPFEYTVDSSFGESIAYINVTSYLRNTNTISKQLNVIVNDTEHIISPESSHPDYSKYAMSVTLKAGDKVQFKIDEANYAMFMVNVNIEKQKP